MRPVEWPAHAAAELSEKTFDSFRRAPPELVRVLVKGVQLWTVVLDERAAMPIIRAVLRNDFDLRAGTAAIFRGIRCRRNLNLFD